ncbi:SDR family oxidoreductase [Microbacterium sp. EYE_5]|uniref:SDR family NAD(P)-dependent oxidoreductase n=1 Tax=unclassified Microbacterium TaxID=2609290 RepID=UPI0020066029|nr:MULTISPECIES: SDR family oxidoreductase [unclassified Microbacterium]MCK6079417.1 SDR family oxidoreductase [Microbacterium sp. EYE_382]MCK6084687.1 SDR family oxidoreductase [Microbacterium sp. EYE_384]MCK6123084.1 SDR family oxidoreductase [Microbacterium sp. EYE_80]MCK6125451.1 SDR family oxidoreductase [Microbacterium sp. EYE_79]MCK6140371.1 SDR family oxidoreductase [Microbacterium sp. EYE_39]
MKLEGNVFAVTGAGNGMGREVTLELVRRGARVAAIDRDPNALARTAELTIEPSRVSTHVADVTDVETVAGLPGQIVKAQGRVDGLVNIAGIIHRFVPSTELSRDEQQRVMNVNFWGTVNMCEAFLPVLAQRPQASLTNMSSLSALIAFAGQTMYGASKGAVKQYTEGLFQELHGGRVEISAIYPGNIATEISKNSGVAMIDAKGQKVRATTPHDAGVAIVSGIEKGRFRILVGSDAKLLDTLVRVAPRWTTKLIARQMASVL